VLTDEQQTDMYPAATMETADSATENLYYSKLTDTRTTLPAGYPTDTTTNPNNYVIRLTGTAGHTIGPGITLKVMAGDQFSIKASSWYKANGSNPGTPANPLTDLLVALIGGVGGIPGGHLSPAQLTANSTLISTNVTQLLGDTTGAKSITITRPHAFVNWVLFDNQMNYVSASSGFDQVGTDQEFKKHVQTSLPLIKSGYLYIYVSNETPNIDVFFDNLQVTHVRGPLLEENHYYPFGLTMAGISDKALKMGYQENKYRFNKGSELQSKEFSDGTGLELYETPLRSLDPQLGRWWQIDPKPTDMESPYSSMGNNPILTMDPLGDTLDFPDASPEFIAQFNNAYAHLNAHGVGDVLTALRNRPEHISVIELDPEADVSPDFVANGNIIHWSPFIGITTDGVTVSPSVSLDHEASHALQWLRHPEQYLLDTDPRTGSDKQYDLKEERRVIVGREQKTARALGEIKKGQVTRKRHSGGHNTRVSGPRSRTSVVEQMIFQQLKKDHEFKRQHPIIKDKHPCIGCGGPPPSRLKKEILN